MITISGCAGKGTLWGTFSANWVGTSSSYTTRSALDACVPPGDWYLPPPDNVWYPVGSSPYGPRSSGIKIGWIDSVDKDSSDFNPCRHSTITGDALYRGPDGSLGPYWTKFTPSACKSKYTSCIQTIPPLPLGQSLVTMNGRPCTQSNPYVYGNKGDKVRYSATASNDERRRWYSDTSLCSSICPPSVQETLAPYGVPSRTGQWYCRSIRDTVVPVGEYEFVRFYFTTWKRPESNVFVRSHIVEYHTTSSYTRQQYPCPTEIPFCQEVNETVSTIKITSIRSAAAGRFEIKYDIEDGALIRGQKLWDEDYSNYTVVSKKDIIASLLILEPGLTQEVSIPTEKADAYCSLAPERAGLLYSKSSADAARTAAVNDVQELDSNWLENLSGVKGAMDCLRPLLDGYIAIKNGDLKAARRCLAGGYLAYKYAIAPGISDTENLSNDGSRILDLATKHRFSNERRRGMAVQTAIPVLNTQATCSYFTTYHLSLRNDYFSQVWNALEKLGIDPSSGQLWELIPYSFVLDWFLPIGNTLTNIDRYNSMYLHRKLVGRIESFKAVWPLEDESIDSLFDSTVVPNGAPLEYSWYRRLVFRSMGTIDPIAISNNNGLTVSQMAQGAALLSQYLR